MIREFIREGDGESFWRTRLVIGTAMFLFMVSQVIVGIANAGEWRVNLLRGSTTAATVTGTTQDEAWKNCLAKINPPAAGSVTYTCQTPRYVATTTATPTPPQPVDCAGTWSDWTPTSAWTACSAGIQSRTESRSFTVTTAPANGGQACPDSPQTRTATQACTDPVTPPVTGDITQSPPNADMSALQPGQTLVLKAGAYTSLKLKACTSSAWCTVKAETDGAVSISNLAIGKGQWFVRMEGLKFTGSGTKAINGSYVKVFRTAFEGGPASGNSMAVQIGTNDYSPGADHVLLEDCWAYAPGGRYKFLVYNATDVVLRRIVSRYDGSTQGDGAPQADVTVYDSQRVEVQNAIAVDTVLGPGSSQYIAAFYNIRNGTGGVGDGTKAWRGSVVIHAKGYIMGTEGNGGAQTGVVVDNVAGVGGDYGVSQLSASNASYSHMTVLNMKNDGIGIYGGNASLANSVVAGNGQNLRGISCTSCDQTKTVVDLTQPGSNGRGALIANRIGVSGTLYGEPGYNDLTSDALWPWPNEARIKADMDGVRVTFGAKSITEYVKTALQ